MFFVSCSADVKLTFMTCGALQVVCGLAFYVVLIIHVQIRMNILYVPDPRNVLRCRSEHVDFTGGYCNFGAHKASSIQDNRRRGRRSYTEVRSNVNYPLGGS
jgi:hypothetical protein